VLSMKRMAPTGSPVEAICLSSGAANAETHKEKWAASVPRPIESRS
jgi:hypothetical protein